jgi:thymidylate synthase (FAD)
MREQEIKIYNIARTSTDLAELRKWIDDLGAPEYDIPHTNTDGFDYDDGAYEKGLITDSARLIGLAGKRCYMSFGTELNPNITRVRNDWGEYLDNVMKSGHGSVTEHPMYTFAIEGVTRIFTAEMNRHRAGVGISEGSMRYIRLDDIPFWMPLSIRLTDEDKLQVDILERKQNKTEEEIKELEEYNKKLASQDIFRRAFMTAEHYYLELNNLWKEELSPESKFKLKKELTSMMRRIIPIGVSTGGVWTGNIRALRHIITMRAAPEAEEEIAYVFSHIAKMMVEKEPMLFGDFEQDDKGFWYPKYRKI